MLRSEMEKYLTSEFDELNKLSAKIRLLETLINSAIILLAGAIIMQFFSIPVFYALLPGFAYILISISNTKQCSITVDKISEKYPEIEEQLKTACDNKDKKDIIVTSLLSDVSTGMDKMQYSSFFEAGRMTIRILIVVFLSFILLSTNLINFADTNSILNRNLNFLINLGDLDIIGNSKDSGAGRNQWEVGNYTSPKEMEKAGTEGGGQRPGVSQGPEPGRGGGTGEDPNKNIYSNPSSAKIEGKDIKMEMHPEFGGEIEIKDTSQDTTPGEFSISSAKSAKTPEQEPVEYQAVIKRYFERLLEEGNKEI